MTVLFVAFSRRGLAALQHGAVSACSVFQALGHAADGGGGHTRILADIGVTGTRCQHTCGLETLGYVEYFLDGAGILKEGVTLVPILEGQDGIEQGIHVGIMKGLHGDLAVSFITLVW